MTLTRELSYQASIDGTPLFSSSASELTVADEAERFQKKKVRRAVAVREDFPPMCEHIFTRSKTCTVSEGPLSKAVLSPRQMKSAVTTTSGSQHCVPKVSKQSHPKSVKFYYSEMKLPDRLFPPHNSQFIADVSSGIPMNWRKPPEYVAGFFEALVQYSKSTLTTAIAHPQFTPRSSPSKASSISSSPLTKLQQQQSHYFANISKAFDKTVIYWSRKLDKSCMKDQRKAVQHMLLWYANCKRLEILMTTFYPSGFTSTPSRAPQYSFEGRAPLFGSVDLSLAQRDVQLRNVAALFNDLSQSGLMKAFRRLRPSKFPV